MLFLNSLSLASLTCDKLRANYMVHSFCCVLWSWILFPCSYLDNNCSILFFILLSAKDFIAFYDKFNVIFQIFFNIFKPIKIKIINLASFITRTFCSNCYNFLIKRFWWFYFVDTKDGAFFSFCFLICLNYFLVLFGLIILEV